LVDVVFFGAVALDDAAGVEAAAGAGAFAAGAALLAGAAAVGAASVVAAFDFLLLFVAVVVDAGAAAAAGAALLAGAAAVGAVSVVGAFDFVLLFLLVEEVVEAALSDDAAVVLPGAGAAALSEAAFLLFVDFLAVDAVVSLAADSSAPAVWSEAAASVFAFFFDFFVVLGAVLSVEEVVEVDVLVCALTKAGAMANANATQKDSIHTVRFLREYFIFPRKIRSEVLHFYESKFETVKADIRCKLKPMRTPPFASANH
jgi:hypothetical protein